jgi:ABC-2 type transport system ATP-binding protein
VITVNQLSKKYGRQTVVDSLTFEVKKGEVLGFLGPNGAGKTTTMRMLTGYLPPSHGRIRIAGFDMYDHPVEAKRQIGYLPENPPVYLDMTVERYLDFVAEIKDVPARLRHARVDRAIGRAQLGDVRRKRIGKLSKGFRQRVGLAQAIVHEPPLLILDEPTSSLDPKQRAEVRDLITELKGEHTVILSTHILPEASAIADRVFIINKGKVMAVDTPGNLAARLQGRQSALAEFVVPASVHPGEVNADTVRAAFEGLGQAGALAVEALGDRAFRVRLDMPENVDARPDVAALVVTRQWRLRSLTGDVLSLEDIFLKLTSSEDESPRVAGDGE